MNISICMFLETTSQTNNLLEKEKGYDLTLMQRVSITKNNLTKNLASSHLAISTAITTTLLTQFGAKLIIPHWLNRRKSLFYSTVTMSSCATRAIPQRSCHALREKRTYSNQSISKEKTHIDYRRWPLTETGLSLDQRVVQENLSQKRYRSSQQRR